VMSRRRKLGRVTRNQWFESCSLQRGVQCEPNFPLLYPPPRAACAAVLAAPSGVVATAVKNEKGSHPQVLPLKRLG